ncbi:unnamed protein product, partial [Symbiodinium necroappetens]
VDLPNRIYVVVRDVKENIYDPVRVFSTWRDTQWKAVWMAAESSVLGEAAAQDLGCFALAKEEGPIFDYGLVAVRPKAVEGAPWVALAVIGEDADGELVVALPGGAWHRTASRRRVPTASLKSPRAFSVRLAAPEAREQALEATCRVWVAGLRTAWAQLLDFVAVGEEDLDLGYSFGEGEQIDCVPFAEDLIEAAGDRITYQTAAEGDSPEHSARPAFGSRSEPGWATRVADLERDMGQVQQGVKDILAKLGGGPAEGANQQQPATSRPSALRPTSRGKAPPPSRELGGLDPAVVQAARAAGVPDSHLQEMARVVQGTLKDPPAPAKTLWAPSASLAALDQTDDEPEEETADEAQLQEGDRMTAAIEKLTAIAESLTAGRRKASTLEGLLEAGGSTDASGSASTSRRNSAALRVLKRALQDHPRELADGMLERMAADFGLARALPGGDRVPVTARAWVESRARIQHLYPSTVRFAWILAGVVDALSRGNYDEGLARSLVGLAAVEQLSLDRGSWTLAEPMLLEEPAPLSSFHGRQILSGSEQPFTRLLDARTVELLVYQVKEVDEYLERRKKLGTRRPGPTVPLGRHRGQPGHHGGQGRQRQTEGQSEGRCGPRGASMMGPSGHGGHGVPSEFVSAGESPPHVPGSSAKPVLPSSLWAAIPRWLLRLRTPFARFFHCLVTEKPERGCPATGGLFPMPLPYPGVYMRSARRRTPPTRLAERHAVNLAVAALSWLSLGQPTAAPAELSLGRPLSGEQRGAVRRLERATRVLARHTEVGPADMGRAAAKVEAVEKQLARLVQITFALSSMCKHYLGAPDEMHYNHNRPQPGSGSSPRSSSSRRPLSGTAPRDGELGLGKAPDFGDANFYLSDPAAEFADCLRFGADAETVAKNLESHRLALSGRPTFDPSPHLDPEARSHYLDPSAWMASPDTLQEPLPKPKFKASRAERLKVLAMLDSTDRLRFVPAACVDYRFTNGLFAIIKDQSRDRLILDARCPNLLEAATGRWIRTLAAAPSLLSLSLEPGEELVMAGEDLKDYYYYFWTPTTRFPRNVLAGALPESVARAYAGFEFAEAGHGRYYAALNTLAMGDRNAVTYGQTAHLSILLSCTDISLNELITLDSRPARGGFCAGICIDDFVCLEKRQKGSGVPKRSKHVVSSMRASYKEAGLERSEKKAFENVTKASFWGASVNGESRDVRALPSRALPVMSYVLEVSRIGLATRALLDVIAGSLVSLFSFRRRLLCLLDLVYSEGRGLPRDLVFSLSDRLRDELCVAALLVATAATNLRARHSPLLLASDASLEWEAGVETVVGEPFAKELFRHSLVKPLWNRLLRPLAARDRAAGVLPTSEELPENEVKAHPLWSELARTLPFGEPWRRPCKPGRHINISEVRAALHAEARHARRHPCSRVNLALDSQVALGALGKGRSSSDAINRELRKSLAVHLGYDSYLGLLYFASAENPADDGTRNVPLRKPAKEAPDWWSAACEGDFVGLDDWLAECAALPEEALELPSVAELGVLRSPASSRRQARRDWWQRPPQTRPPLAAAAPSGFRSLLPAAVTEKLLSVPAGQFVVARGGTLDLSQKGFLDLYSGSFGVARALAKATGCWVLTYELRRDAAEDLRCPRLQEFILDLLSSGAFFGVGAAPVCSSMSRAVRPAVRSTAWPQGLPNCRPAMRERVADGNNHADFTAAVAAASLATKTAFWVENPACSFLWAQPSWQQFINEAGDAAGFFLVDFCRCGAPWRKRTKVFTSTSLQGQRLLCECTTPHRRLSGYSKELGMMMTKAAEHYPRKLNLLLSAALGEACRRPADRRHVSASDICRSQGHRIGEAKNPGPELANLEEIQLVSQRTRALQTRLLADFGVWLGANFSAPAVPSYKWRHICAYFQKENLLLRPYMPLCWDLVTRWERVCPTAHRTPIPHALAKAVISVALGFGWPRFAAVVGLSFYGTARVGEPLLAKRSAVLLPQDLLLDDLPTCYVRVEAQKSAHRGTGRVQHFVVRQAVFVDFLSRLLGGRPLEERIFSATASTFRRRWETILQALGIPRYAKLTPGGLRGGGAVFLYQLNTPIHDACDCVLRLLWKATYSGVEGIANFFDRCGCWSWAEELVRPFEVSVGAAARAFLLSSEKCSVSERAFMYMHEGDVNFSSAVCWLPPSHPGAVEELVIVAKYTSQIQSWPWKTCNLQGPWQVEDRAFDGFDQLASSSEFKQLHSPNICETCVRAMGNVCQCCGARDKDPSLLPDYASGGNSQHGFALAKNDRGRMEDAVAISDKVAGHACFAVFDGHGGDKATVLAKQFLPLQLEKHLEQESNKEKAAHQAFAAMDELMQKQLAEEAKVLTAGTSSGTVACIALLQEGELVLLNLGDCRAVVCENGKVGTSTRDHHPEKNDQEKQRLEKLGVCIEGGYVDGKVQVSRALGDIVDKTGQKILGLSNTPEVTRIEVKKTTEFVILATDGVWDGLREQLAITTARKILRETKSAEGAAKAVLEAAGKVTKADNAAVIVVSLNIPEPLPKRDAPPSRFQRNSKTECLFLLFHEALPQNHVKEPAAYNTLMPPNTVSIGCPTQNQRAGFQHLTVKVQIAQAPAFQIQDMAIRVFSAKSRALLSTLPPPPNAKEWQLLILWLSSEEAVAIFYVPSAPLEKSKAEEQPIPRTQAATPLLLRRFSIVEVRTQMMDKDLSKESFRCVSLYHGPLPKGDTLLHTVKVAQQVLEEDSSPASPRRHIPKQTAPTGFVTRSTVAAQKVFAYGFIFVRRRRQCFRHGDKDGKELTLMAGASLVLQLPSVAVQRRASPHGAAAELRAATARRAAALRRKTNHWVRGSSAGGKRPLAVGSLLNAKMDSKSLRKMGLMCLLSYGFVSNVNALLLILLATYRSIVATGASPLASPVALKQFGITWAGLYVISNIVRPVRISIALAISKPFDNMVNWLQEKLSCKRWMAVGLVVLLLNVVLTIAFLWGGMLFVSSITGVKVDPSQRDWYLLVGTQMGTLQAFKIADLLMQLPVWGRLAPHLPNKEHTRRSPGRAKTMRASVLKGAIKEADGRLAEIEKEHEAAMEASRTPGQRPFPPSGPQLKLYSRWRRHDYSIDFVKSMADLILTIDAKNGLKVCQAEDSRILFRLLLPEFSCLTPYIVLVDPATEDQRSTEGDAQGQVESAAEVPPPSSPQLLGVTLGNSRGSLEMVELPWTSPDVEVFSSQASHGGPVLQVDYLLPIEIFVSVGEDDTVRFWSSALQLLREVFFPQPCSTVAFLRLPDMDTSAGHGDVLVGFAAHVERVPMDVWARGVKHEKLGGTLPLDSTMRSSQGSKATGSSAFTKSSTQEMDELLLQELNRFSPEDEDVLGERPPSSEIVKLVDEELPKRRRSRTVMDFRGAPVVPLGVLGGLAADMVGVEERLSHRPEALEHVPHEHSQVLDQGDLRAITRYHAGYYDWTVNPSAMVDAPRGCAIRGVTGDGNVAIVTSVGIGHLRGEGHAFQPAPQEAPSEELFAHTSLEEELEAGELPDEAPLALPGPSSPRPATGASAATSVAATARRPDSNEPRLESRTSARTGEAQARGALEECVEETDDEGMVNDE